MRSGQSLRPVYPDIKYMSEPSSNVVSDEPAASQADVSEQTNSQSDASAQLNLDTNAASQDSAAEAPRQNGKGQLPFYTRSLLRVKVPVVVTLAEKKQKLGRIVELGPGQIIQFEKSCEEMLDLEVGNRKIATGAAVKVGDKFGLRINSIVLPEERFLPLKPKK
jgi:flagellar motor switch protein FliN/FliY